MSWLLQEAKQKFSELARRALEEGPQVLTRHGEGGRRGGPGGGVSAHGEQQPDFKEYLMSAPEGLELIIPERPPNDFPREVDLTSED